MTVRLTVIEAFGAISALQHETLAALRGRNLFFQRLDFPGDDQGR
jgi:hypothetical protein